MGIDFSGVIEGVPAGARDFLLGDRVFGMARTHGSYAEYNAIAAGVKTGPQARIPDGVTPEHAAALPIAGSTALRSLDLLGVAANQQLVVMGAIGGYAAGAAHAAVLKGLGLLPGAAGSFPDHDATVIRAYVIQRANDGKSARTNSIPSLLPREATNHDYVSNSQR